MYYKTTAACGHGQSAILVRLSENEFITVARFGFSDADSDSYRLGEFQEFSSGAEVAILTDSQFSLKDCQLAHDTVSSLFELSRFKCQLTTPIKSTFLIKEYCRKDNHISLVGKDIVLNLTIDLAELKVKEIETTLHQPMPKFDLKMFCKALLCWLENNTTMRHCDYLYDHKAPMSLQISHGLKGHNASILY